MKSLYPFLLLFPSLLYCTQMGIRHDLQQLQSKKINIPKNLRTTYNGKDTSINDVSKRILKFIVYSDSENCTSCTISKMYLWKSILKSVTQFNGKMKFYFILFPSNDYSSEVTIIALLSNPLDYPVLIDKNGDFEKMNPHLPKNKAMHTFLLDENNKVILVGNPLNNKEIENLFYKKTQELLSK